MWNVVLPRFIAKQHNRLITRYNNHKKFSLIESLKSFGKSLDGHYFSVNVQLKIYPFFDKGYNLISHISKLKEKDLIIIVNQDDRIVDCSEDLFEIFNLNKRDLDTARIYEICPEMERISIAYGQVYTKDETDLIIDYQEGIGDFCT